MTLFYLYEGLKMAVIISILIVNFQLYRAYKNDRSYIRHDDVRINDSITNRSMTLVHASGILFPMDVTYAIHDYLEELNQASKHSGNDLIAFHKGISTRLADVINESGRGQYTVSFAGSAISINAALTTEGYIVTFYTNGYSYNIYTFPIRDLLHV